MLTENDSHYLYQDLLNNARNQDALNIVNGTGAKFGVDGDQYFYGFGNLPDPDSVFGFGKTPSSALTNFQVAYYSQTVKPINHGR
jgi:hypothetical protein